ncbi:cysteine dioxygenase [Nocardia sp. 004]|uniref:cysteine dioxygenase n=1 Tax=Nocardia sp. 004 TaxID=3385978 RepID=UPI0039A25680
MRSSVPAIPYTRNSLSAAAPLERSTGLISPARLRPPELLRSTDECAESVLSGHYDHLLPASGHWPVDQRWAIRLWNGDEVDFWLISWVPGKPTGLHDHAGSLGALTVLSGTLSEYRWNGTELRYRTLMAGDQAAFPVGWVHDVVRASAGVSGATESAGAIEPTLSVHAYSPPLTAMSYYEVTEHGTLRRTRTVRTDQPEGDM